MSEGPYETLSRLADGFTEPVRDPRLVADRRAGLTLPSTAAPRSPWRSAASPGLVGLLPTGVTTLDGQSRRIYAQYLAQANPIWVSGCIWRTCGTATRCCFTGCCPSTSPRCCRWSTRPRSGLAIERFSHEFRRTARCLPVGRSTRGRRVRVAQYRHGRRATSTCSWPPTPRASSASATKAWAASKSPVGKLAVYTAAAGIHPAPRHASRAGHGHRQPRPAQRRDVPGRQARPVRDQRYDELIDAYVTAPPSSSRTRCCTGRTSVRPMPAAS